MDNINISSFYMALKTKNPSLRQHRFTVVTATKKNFHVTSYICLVKIKNNQQKQQFLLEV